MTCFTLSVPLGPGPFLQLRRFIIFHHFTLNHLPIDTIPQTSSLNIRNSPTEVIPAMRLGPRRTVRVNHDQCILEVKIGFIVPNRWRVAIFLKIVVPGLNVVNPFRPWTGTRNHIHRHSIIPPKRIINIKTQITSFRTRRTYRSISQSHGCIVFAALFIEYRQIGINRRRFNCCTEKKLIILSKWCQISLHS